MQIILIYTINAVAAQSLVTQCQSSYSSNLHKILSCTENHQNSTTLTSGQKEVTVWIIKIYTLMRNSIWACILS